MRVEVSGQGEIRFLPLGSANPAMGMLYGPTIFFATTDDELYTKDLIVNSPSSVCGERSCHHVRLEGTALAVPSRDIDSKVVSVPLYGWSTDMVTVMQTTSKSTRGQTFVRQGPVVVNKVNNFHMKFPDSTKKKYGTKTWYRNVSCSMIVDSPLVFHYLERFEYSSSPDAPIWHLQETWSHIVMSPDLKKCTWNGARFVLPVLQRATKDPDLQPFNLNLVPKTWTGYEDIRERLARKFSSHSDSEVYGDLVRRCANDAQVIQTNSIELVTELATIADTVKTTLGLFRGKVDAKKLASGWLSYKYGLRLTAHDLKTVVQGISKRVQRIDRAHARSRARETFSYEPFMNGVGTLDVEYNYKIIYRTHSDDLRDFVRAWFNSGLFPSLTNAWDLIPLSFVVDWFLEIESYLNGMDANTYWSSYSIVETVYSKKETYHDVNQLFSPVGWTLVGEVQLVDYNRHLGYTVHKPLYFDPNPREFKNYAELTSLIVVFLSD